MPPEGAADQRRTHLQPADDLLQRQGALGTSDKGGRGQPEDLVQVGLIQTVEAYKSHDAAEQKHTVEQGQEEEIKG